MSRYNVECSTCGTHIGYVYHSAPIGWVDCVECGDAEQERKEREDDDEHTREWIIAECPKNVQLAQDILEAPRG